MVERSCWVVLCCGPCILAKIVIIHLLSLCGFVLTWPQILRNFYIFTLVQRGLPWYCIFLIIIGVGTTFISLYLVLFESDFLENRSISLPLGGCVRVSMLSSLFKVWCFGISSWMLSRYSFVVGSEGVSSTTSLITDVCVEEISEASDEIPEQVLAGSFHTPSEDLLSNKASFNP